MLITRRGDFPLVCYWELNALVPDGVWVHTRVVEHLTERAQVDAKGSRRQVLRRHPRLNVQVRDAFGGAGSEGLAPAVANVRRSC
jgi:hypothetical protein